MSSIPMDPAVPPVEAEPGMNVMQRSVAMFVSPTRAWSGLKRQVQFWFPLLLLVICSTLFTSVLWEHALVPDMRTSWEQMVDNGQMTQDQVDKADSRMAGPVTRIVASVINGIVIGGLMLLVALATWFGVGFILGTKFTYRMALEVTAWSALVLIPGMIVTGALAWSQESMKHATIGLGSLLPESETPSKMMGGVKAFLDAFDPFRIWSLIVSIFGASALSGAPRRSVAWVSIAVFLVFALFGASMAALFGPGR